MEVPPSSGSEVLAQLPARVMDSLWVPRRVLVFDVGVPV